MMQNDRSASFKAQIEAYMKEHEAAILTDLQKLISFRTVSEEKGEIEKSLDWFLGRARDMGFKNFKTSTNDVGVVEAGQGDEILGILVHLDVVDIGDPDKWNYPPFEGTISEGSIWGRGTMDDKGAAIVCLYGMKALADLGAAFHKKIWLIVGTGEEEDWTDMEHYKKEFRLPDYGFSPDGDFPIYNIENGYADVVLEFDEREAIGMYGDFDVESGKSANTVPSKAVLTLNGEQIVFEGVSAHSSSPELGVNAIGLLCASEGSFNFSRFVNEILACDHYGGRLNFRNEEEYWDGQYLGRTTVAPTVLKRAGNKVLLTVNIRQNASLTGKDLESAFDEYREKYHYDYKITSYLEALKVNCRMKPFTVMAETYEDWGYENSFIAAGGTSYAKAMKNIVTWGPCFPEDLSCAHKENEKIGLAALFRAMGIYTDYMYRVVSETESFIER
jgi:succinyl-diaminopimelate desuccinylase